ncbi:MAG: potassium channel protein [Spirochaetes bacterium]|jgi:voltage-gated potassium channel|nr:potassium channel protein [Spirochaetota bacterium]
MIATLYKKVIKLLSLMIGTLSLGTVLYYIVEERMSLFDSFYMTLITISTVGFQEIFPLSRNGRIVTIIVIISGIFIVGYSAGSLIQIIVEGEIKESFGRKKMNRIIEKMKNHYIVCGYGRIGGLIASELSHNGYDCVVVENNTEIQERLKNEKIIHIIGDATNEEVLNRAGIKRAKAIVTALQSDADNVFIVLTSRSINPNIYILARASEISTESKLKRAGATKVIFPHIIGGKRMAQSLIRPAVVDFMDMTMLDTEFGLELGEVTITVSSPYIGKTLLESNIRNDYGIIIIAIKKQNGSMLFNPTSDLRLDKSDVLIFVGKKKKIAQLQEMM